MRRKFGNWKNCLKIPIFKGFSKHRDFKMTSTCRLTREILPNLVLSGKLIEKGEKEEDFENNES